MAKSKVITSSLVLGPFVADAGGKELESAATEISRGLKDYVHRRAVQMGFSQPRAVKLSEQLAADLECEVRDRVGEELRALKTKSKRRQ